MSWLKPIVALLSAALVAACGFVPIAATNGAAGAEGPLVVRDISIVADDERFAYQLRRDLEKYVTVDPAARYSLSVKSKIETSGLAITTEDEITRINYESLATYELVGIADDPSYRGETRSVAAVNATTDTFATEASARAAVGKLATATSQKLITALRVLPLRGASLK